MQKTTKQLAIEVNQRNAIEQAEQDRKDYQAERLKRAFNLVIEIYPEANRKRALIIAGEMLIAFDQFKKTHYH